MSIFRLPFTWNFPWSGDVTQFFKQWNAFSGQFGLININLGRSNAPAVEEDVLSEVGSYGRQLGVIGDALVVLVKHLPKGADLKEEEVAAIESLKVMLRDVAKIKRRHGREASSF